MNGGRLCGKRWIHIWNCCDIIGSCISTPLRPNYTDSIIIFLVLALNVMNWEKTANLVERAHSLSNKQANVLLSLLLSLIFHKSFLLNMQIWCWLTHLYSFHACNSFRWNSLCHGDVSYLLSAIVSAIMRLFFSESVCRATAFFCLPPRCCTLCKTVSLRLHAEHQGIVLQSL